MKKKTVNLKCTTLFDSDGMDNSANCIIWLNKKDFIPSSYVTIDTQKLSIGIDTVHGNSVPSGIGTLQICWHDDDSVYNKFEIKDVFHMPESLVNVLGVPAFSLHIGNYNEEGTSISSTSKSSVFNWNNDPFILTFKHPESNLPQMTVNCGFPKYLRFHIKNKSQ